MSGKPPDHDLRQLIYDAQVGDRNAFAILYERSAVRLTAILRRQFWDKTEDVVHDAFLRAFIKLDSFAVGDDPAKLEAQWLSWLLTLARNEAIGKGRRQRPQTGIDLSHSTTKTDVFEAIVVREQQAILESCLAKLEEIGRELIASQYGAEEEHSTVCRRLGITIERGYKLRHKALEQLRICAKRSER